MQIAALIRFVVFLCVLLAGSTAWANFYFLETDDLRLVYYGRAHSFIVNHVARCYENALGFHKDLFGYSPWEKTTVVVHDLSDYGNGGAGTCPHNRISLGIAPISYAYETTPANERINATLNHELVHILAADNAAGSDRFFRRFFRGKIAENSENPLTMLYSHLTVPRRSTPVWYHEGIAVFMETWMAGGLGRALGAYDEMVFRSMVQEDSHFYDIQGLESEGTKVDFHVGVNSYLYGTRFFSYLALQYGPQSLVEWTSRSDGSRAHFASQFKRTYDISMSKAWSEWIEWEKEFQRANLDAVTQYPVTSFRPLCDRALGSVSQPYVDLIDSVLYCAVNYPGQVAHLASIDLKTGAMQKMTDLKGSSLFYVTSLVYDSTSRTLFYTTDNNSWRDLVSLNVVTGEKKKLLKDARVGDLAFNYADSSLWGVRHSNGLSALVRIPRPYEEWNLVRAFPYGQDIYDIDLSLDGSHLAASLAEVDGRQQLILMDVDKLMAGDTSFAPLHNFGNSIPANFVFSPDGRFLYGAAYYTGVSNIFRYDLRADSMEAVTNCETGFFRPTPLSDDSLIAFRYSTSGFTPGLIPNQIIEDIAPITYLGQRVIETHPVLETWNVGSPATVDLDTMVIDSGAYSELGSMRFRSWYPIVEGYKDYTAVGAHLDFAGTLGLDRSSLTASYTPDEDLPEEERYHLKWSYSHMDWSVAFKYNGADFYDLVGPTRTSRKGYSLGLRHSKTLLYDPPRSMTLGTHVTAYGGLERLPEYQNIITSFDKFISYGGTLSFQNLRASLGAVDFEKGYRWQLMTSNTYVRRKLFPRYIASLDLGTPLLVSHTSLWLRISGGYAHGDRIQPLANFYFGGFGNNWLDHQAVRRYRGYSSFPGTDLNEIAGINFVKTMVEINLPPLRFRHFGVPSLFVSWARPSVFVTGLKTNLDDDAATLTVGNIGSQIDLRMVVMSHLRFTLSFGYAKSYYDRERGTEEYMVSLKVL